MHPVLIDGILYDTENGYEYTVISCEEGVENAVIRLTVNGLPVRGIGENAFENRKALKTVSFIDFSDDLSVNAEGFFVEEYAFSGCSSLAEIELPDFCNSVGRGAFRSCTSLKRAVLYNSYVAPYAFCGCTALTEVSPLSNLSEGVFSHCETLTCLPICDAVEEIDEGAFEHCYSLTEITIPKSVKRIVALAFRSCRSVTSITFEDIKGWYSHSFYTNQEYPIDVSDAKNNAIALSGIDYDDGITAWYKK